MVGLAAAASEWLAAKGEQVMRWVCDTEYAGGIRWVLRSKEGVEVGRVMRIDDGSGVEAWLYGSSGRGGFATMKDAALALLSQLNHFRTKKSFGL